MVFSVSECCLRSQRYDSEIMSGESLSVFNNMQYSSVKEVLATYGDSGEVGIGGERRVTESGVLGVVCSGECSERLDLERLSPKVLKNRDAHIDYIKQTQENADILRGLVEQARVLRPLDSDLDSAWFLNCSMVFGLRMLQAYDRKPLSTHQLRSQISRYDAILSYLSLVKSLKDQVLVMASKVVTFKLQFYHCTVQTRTGKSKKYTHKPKAEDSIQEKLYLLHMDLCGLMRIQSINGRKYILAIVDDYSQFTWLKFLRSKYEVPEFVIKFIKMIQVRLNAIVQNIKTNNGTVFVNQTLRTYYEDVGISHQTSVARSPQQNGVVKRQNRTLVEAARTMLIFLKASLFLWGQRQLRQLVTLKTDP
ncbi:retrovirus-related pol polyprotein from transposon TNT 1-94 [Tanacetum coccineum]